MTTQCRLRATASVPIEAAVCLSRSSTASSSLEIQTLGVLSGREWLCMEGGAPAPPVVRQSARSNRVPIRPLSSGSRARATKYQISPTATQARMSNRFQLRPPFRFQ